MSKPKAQLMFTTDWHFHSRNSCDCREGKIPTTMAETFAAMRATGITDFGVTDHLHTPFNLPDVEASRREFDALPPSPHQHFGIEVSCMSAWEIAEIATGRHTNPVYGLRTGGPADGEMAIGITAAEIARFGIEYVVGGTHWPLYVPLERDAVIHDYHRQNLFLACHPLVTIVAHPWWWMGHWKEEDGTYRTGPWLDDFRKVPQAMHDEFAAAVREHGKVVEINLHAMLLNWRYPERFRRQYCEYLAGLKAAGVPLSVGSDHHAQHSRYGVDDDRMAKLPEAERERFRFSAAAAMLNAVGIREDSLWRLPPRTPPKRQARKTAPLAARPTVKTRRGARGRATVQSADPFPHVVAHRGLSGACPENTLPAFAAAMALGADELELDLWASRDGELVVCHDDTVDRTSNGHGLIRNLDWADIRALDAGNWHAPAWAGVPFCRLEDVFALCGDRLVLNLHIKEPGPDGLVVRRTRELAERFGLVESIYIAGERDVLAWAVKLAPDVARCCLEAPQSGARMLDCALEFGCKRVQFWNPNFTAEDIARAHAAGIVCNLFFGDRPDTAAEAVRLCAAGLDAILTNWPNTVLPAVRHWGKTRR